MRHFIFTLLLFVSCHRSLTSTSCRETESKTNTGSLTLTTSPVMAGENAVIRGKLLDEQKVPAIFLSVAIRKDGITIDGAITDENGNFVIKNIKPGKYEFYLNNIGYEPITKAFTMTTTENIEVLGVVKEEEVQVLKPVIYIYPETACSVHVDFAYQGKLTHTYPKYPINGWHVEAQPNGTLHDSTGQEYYALFWEGRPNHTQAIQDGFVVAGAETTNFLEEKLAYLGLNRREANEFIMFWLPQLEDNPYNLIHFAGEEYTRHAELIIDPQPQTIIRVMMYTSPLQTPIEFPLQDLSTMQQKREGFTVVEWGGSVVPIFIR